MSSLNSLNLARAGELASSATVKPHQKQMVVSLSVEKLSVSSRAESLQYRWLPGHGVKDERRMKRVEK